MCRSVDGDGVIVLEEVRETLKKLSTMLAECTASEKGQTNIRDDAKLEARAAQDGCELELRKLK